MRLLIEFLREKKPLALKEVGVAFLGARHMSRLNKTHLGHTGPTDVITFRHGEIIVCPHIAAKQAALYSQKYPDELLLYLIHGWLHLAGMDDHHPVEARKMFATQNSLLKNFLRYTAQPLSKRNT